MNTCVLISHSNSFIIYKRCIIIALSIIIRNVGCYGFLLLIVERRSFVSVNQVRSIEKKLSVRLDNNSKHSFSNQCLTLLAHWGSPRWLTAPRGPRGPKSQSASSQTRWKVLCNLWRCHSWINRETWLFPISYLLGNKQEVRNKWKLVTAANFHLDLRNNTDPCRLFLLSLSCCMKCETPKVYLLWSFMV